MPSKKPAAKPRRRRIRLLPMTVTMLSLLCIIKANDLYFNSKQLRELYTARDAIASEKKEEKAEEKHGEEKKDEKNNEPADVKKEEKAEGHADAKEEKKDEKSTGHGEEKKPEAAHGEEKKDVKKEESAHGDKKEEAGHGDEKKEEDGHGEKKEEGGHGDGHGGGEKPVEEERTHGTGKSTVKEIEAMKAKQAQPLYTKTEMDLLQNLSKRREELDARERELELKAQILEAADKRIADRMTEMKTLEADMKKTLAQYNEKQDDRLKSLVKIYEGMKPDEAAKIFNEMDMPILLDVIGKMSERKVAPVLANMDPKKARDVTQELAERRKKASGTTGKP